MPDTDLEEENGSIWERNVELPGLTFKVQEHFNVGIGGMVWEGGILLAQFLRSAVMSR